MKGREGEGVFFFSSRRRHTRCLSDWSSDVCSSDLLRWWIGGLLVASTVVNYIDRQTLSVLAPHLKTQFSWNNSDWALIVISFRVAYALLQTVSGRVLDWLGTRRGLLLTVSWYSLAAAVTSLAVGLKSFMCFRFLLGCGEAANWPGATKTVSEWFPKAERGWAVALFDSGSSVGRGVAAVLVFGIYRTYGSWRPVFILTALLGLIWVFAWKAFYHPPETHPNLGPEERTMILGARDDEKRAEAHALVSEGTQPASWAQLLSLRETWGIVLGKALTDPVWFFITDWFAIYLVSKGFRSEEHTSELQSPLPRSSDLPNFLACGRPGASCWARRSPTPSGSSSRTGSPSTWYPRVSRWRTRCWASGFPSWRPISATSSGVVCRATSSSAAGRF